MDELDQLLSGDEDLRAAVLATINSGYKKSGYRLLLEPQKGGGWVPKKLSTYSPKMLAGISGLPAVTLSRCIPITMERMLPTDRVAEIDEYIIEPGAEELKARARKWATANDTRLRAGRPDAPASLGHRQREVSRPLFAIGDIAAAGWPERIRGAVARIFATHNAAPAANVKIELLASIKEVFHGDRMASADLVEALTRLEDRPWATWSKGKPINQNQLARQLKDFKVYPRNIKIATSVLKGYLRESFEPAWERYIPHTPVQAATPLQPASLLNETHISNRYQDREVAVQKCEKPASLLHGSGVAVQSQEEGGRGLRTDGNGRCRIPDCANNAEPGRDHCERHQPWLIPPCGMGTKPARYGQYRPNLDPDLYQSE